MTEKKEAVFSLDVFKLVFIFFIGLVIVANVVILSEVASISSKQGAQEQKQDVVKEIQEEEKQQELIPEAPKIIEVTPTIISAPNCEECFDLNSFVDSIREVELDYSLALKPTIFISGDSNEAKDLIQKYEISSLPALILSKEASQNSAFVGEWNQIGSVEDDGTLVFRGNYPPFVDLKENKTLGLVSMVSLVDSSCTECYDVDLHYQVLTQRFGVGVVNNTVLEYNSTQGKELIQKYNLTGIPTAIISSEVSVYPGFAQTWETFGSVESDGSFVFRNFDSMQNATYRNLSTGELVESNFTGESN